jgi:hypothetical protein
MEADNSVFQSQAFISQVHFIVSGHERKCSFTGKISVHRIDRAKHAGVWVTIPAALTP